jgi:hypothetical protein
VSDRLPEALAAIDAAIERVGGRWYVFGAQAAILWGAPRFTADLDVTVDLGETDTRELVDALAKEGIELLVSDADEFVRQTRVLPLRHRETGLPIDVVLAGPGIEDEFFASARLVEVGGREVPVACVEDLVVMKTLSGRGKDVDDIHALLVAHPECDEARIRRLLGLLEGALDQRDLLPAFDAALARARRARR